MQPLRGLPGVIMADITIAAMLKAAGDELAQEAAAQQEGRFTAKEVIKPDRDVDFYVGWSHVVGAPAWR